jgi:hypothetical protein
LTWCDAIGVPDDDGLQQRAQRLLDLNIAAEDAVEIVIKTMAE